MTHEISFASSFLSWVIFFFGLIVFLGLCSPNERRKLMPISIVAFFLKTILALVYFQVLVNSGLHGFAYTDGINYHRSAIEMANEIASGSRHWSIGWRYNDPGYNYICAYLYWIFGPNTLIPRFLSCALVSAGAIYVFRIARYFFDERTAWFSVLLHLFLPFSMLLTFDQRKDPVTTFLAGALLWHGIRLIQIPRVRLKTAFFLGVFLFLMLYMRSAFIIPYLAVLLIGFTMGSRSIVTAIAGVVIAVGLIVAAQFVIPSGDDASQLQSSLDIEASAERIEGKINKSSHFAQGSGMLRHARVTSLGTIWKAPIAAVLVMILPFPPIFGLDYLPATLFSWANLCGIFLLPFFLWGLFVATRRGRWRQHHILLLFPVVFIVLVGAFDPDVIRYRETAMPAIVVLAAHGYRSRTPLILSIAIYSGLAALAGFMYLYHSGSF